MSRLNLSEPPFPSTTSNGAAAGMISELTALPGSTCHGIVLRTSMDDEAKSAVLFFYDEHHFGQKQRVVISVRSLSRGGTKVPGPANGRPLTVRRLRREGARMIVLVSISGVHSEGFLAEWQSGFMACGG